MKRLLSIAAVFALFSFVLSGCSSDKQTANQIYNHLEKAVSIEQGFLKYQKQLIAKEQKEQDLYKQIVQLKMDSFTEIVAKSKQASKLAGERKQLIGKEKQVMDQAYKEFEQAKPLVDQLKSDQLKKKAEALVNEMDQRHKVYDQLYNDYVQSIQLDQDLYQMLQKKSLQQDTLRAKVNQINSTYQKIDKEKQDFNQYTEKYNKEKKDFYKSAGIPVKASNE